MTFKRKCKTEKGPKLFSYKSVTFGTNFSNIHAENVYFSIDVRGLFSTKYIFFHLKVDTMEIQAFPEPLKLFEMSPHSVRENIGTQVYVHILAMFVKCIQIDLKKFSYLPPNYSLICEDVSFKYSKDYSYSFQLQIPKSEINFPNHLKINFDPITFSPQLGIDPFLSLINLEALILPFEFKLSNMKFFIHGNQLKLNPISVSIVLPRGNITLATPEIKGSMDINVPNFGFEITDVSGFLSRQMYTIPYLVLNVTILSFKKLEITHGMKAVVHVDNFKYSQKDDEPMNISYENAEFFYHTKMMAELLPFLNDHAFVFIMPISNNENKEAYITNSNIVVDKFTFNAVITDKTSLKINGSNFRTKNSEVKLPELKGFINEQKIVSVKKIKVFVNKDKFIQGNADSFHLHDRSGMFLEDSITDIKLCCHVIASYLFSFGPNEESLKFPFVLTFNRFRIKFHDTNLHRSIACASNLIPKINRESIIRQFLLNKKKSEMKLDKDTIKDAEFRLANLAFRNYKERFEQAKKHRYSFQFVIDNCLFSFDSRNFVDKIKMIHQLDPTTKHFYSDIEWEMMLGFNFEFKADSFKIFAFDIEAPIINVVSMNLKGPTIIAGAASKNLANGEFIIDNEVIPLRLNPSNLILFTDMLIAADTFHFYYNYSFQSIYQEMTIRLYGLLPKSVDPSPRFAWFDLLRACFRGQFIFKAENFEWRLSANENYREIDNYLPIRINKFHLLCKEGEFSFNAGMIRTPRIYKGKEGPLIFEIPGMIATIRFHWGSKSHSNKIKQTDEEVSFDDSEDIDLPKKFIIIPDVNSFKDENYDAFKYFRAKKIFIDDMTIFFSRTENIAPSITVDIAHLNWLIQPIAYSVNRRHIKGQIAKKLGFRELQKPPYAKYFIELKATGHMKAIGDVFIIRVFDHFPVNKSIQGSSIDFKFQSFTAYSDFGAFMHEYLANSKFKCDSLSLNATDLSYYAYGGLQTCSPTILIMKPFCFEYCDEAKIKVNELLLHLNQLLLKYLIDFFTSINFKLTIPNSQCKVDSAISDFPICKVSVSVNDGKVFLTSLESALQIVLVLKSTGFEILSNNENEKGFHYEIASISMYLNGKRKHKRRHRKHRRKHKSEDTDDSFSNDIEMSDNSNDTSNDINSSEMSEGEDSYVMKEKNDNAMNPFLNVNKINIFYANRNMISSFGQLVIFATTNDVSIIKYLWTEFWTDTDQPAPSTHVKGCITEFRMSTTIPNIKITLSIDNDVAEINFKNVTGTLNKTNNKTKEVSLTLMDAIVKNLSKDAAFSDALIRWKEQSVSKANRPHIQFLLKLPPKMKYAYIFSQAEFNMEPSIINYDAQFWETFMAFVNARFEKKPPKSHKQFNITTGDDVPMPFVVYDQSLFPSISSSEAEDYSTNKTIHVNKNLHNEHIVFMFRYLRINPISMNVSYKNTDNKILSEINNFQGQMHEIIYHDLTTTVEDLISKIMFDVAKDILPQFLKHVVGFKKQGATPEQEMEEWLKSDDKTMSKEDKQKMLLFGSRTFKKK